MSSNNKRIIIVGAGIAGLTLAYKLTRDGKEVLLVEKEPEVGGLARSFEYGGYIFDIGPHRFHTDIPAVNEFIRDILQNDYLIIERKSGVWMFGRYFEWPLRPLSLLGMPLPSLFSVGIDLLKRRGDGGESFENYIINRYGRTLYKIFFEPYTKKFLKLPCSEVSSDWAVAGIERAVIDKKIRMDDLYGFARSLIYPRERLRFIYPKSGGIGVFSDYLKERINSNGGSILLNSKIEKIFKGGGEVKGVVIGGEYYACDLLIWTGPVNEILQLLCCDKVDLEYLSLILYNYRVNHPPLFDYQWCYYGSESIPFNRISIPSLFNPELAPSGKSGICVEVTCRKGEFLWDAPHELEPEIRRSLKKTAAIKDEKDILDFNIERIPNTYPMYKLNYQEEQKRAMAAVAKFENIKLLGRTGSFWYNNMDHSINAAIALYKNISNVENPLEREE